MIRISVQPEPFSVEEALGPLEALGGGAVASFIGLVRADDGVEALSLEHYPGMTEAALRTIAQEAVARWSLLGAVIVHRVGTLRPGERIVLAAASAGRAERAARRPPSDPTRRRATGTHSGWPRTSRAGR